ncbi:MAG TPA: PKD domain-containing protein, partial [Actinomycetota bacterium]|nr:PKD domain-containing protein [Actinomycetota bacterium]
RFAIQTPTATAWVKGTVYAVLVNADGSTTIATLEGLVSASADAGAVDVPTGKMVVVSVDGSVGPLLDIPAGFLNSEWISFNRCALEAAVGCEPPESDDPGPDGEPGDEPGGPRPAPDGENSGGPPTRGDDALPPRVNQQPDAGFIASPRSGPAPLRVDFTDTSVDPDGDPLTRAWDFGDGPSQNAGTSPTHTYGRRGNYTVTLVVTDPSGASDTQTRVISVITRGDDEAPVVRITSGPDDPTHARNAHFRFRSSEAGTGFVCTLDGDRQPCGPGSPAQTGNDVIGSVDYSDLSTGPHSFRVSMADPSGNSGSDSYSWTIVSQTRDLDHIVISPSTATIELGDSKDYTAEAFDTNGDSMGDVTADTKFTIQPSGSCSGNTCTPTSAGSHTIVGKFSGGSDVATLMVEEPPAAACPHYALSFHTRPPASIEAGRPFNVQIRVEILSGGDPDGPLTISLGGAAFSSGETSEVWSGNGTVVFNGLRIDQPGSYDVIATAQCASPTDPTSVTVTDGPGGNAGEAIGLAVLLPVSKAIRRRRG